MTLSQFDFLMHCDFISLTLFFISYFIAELFLFFYFVALMGFHHSTPFNHISTHFEPL